MSVFSVIMLFLILCVLCLTLAEEINFEDPDFSCAPKSIFQVDCNTCTCAEDGKTVFCTYRLCPKAEGLILPDHPEFRCIPGDLFTHSCYDCRCYDGVNAFCKHSLCRTKNANRPKCEDGEAKKQDCNNCKCINGEWACTRKFCIPEVEIFENKNCDRGSMLRRGCNLCRCVPGVGFACDKEECPPDQPTDIIHDKNCEENSVYNIGCNICKCVPGLGYACDNSQCSEAVFVN